jgi:hypothetical protein
LNVFISQDALRQDDSPYGVKNQFVTAIAPIYFVIFVLMAQFVLVNVVVAVLMKKLDVNKKDLTKANSISFVLFSFKGIKSYDG